MDIYQIKGLLEKYQRGACSSTEVKLIEDWLSGIKNDRPDHFDDKFIEDQLGVAQSRINAIIDQQTIFDPKKQYNWLAIAASILVVATVSVTIGILYLKKHQGNQLAAQPGIKQYISNGYVYIQTQKGITDHIKLPDGSFITLNSSSNLRYPVKFINHKRPVYLDEGEALFDVAKDKTSPFTVYTPKFATTALGTAFNIRSYAKEHKVSISLIHGKIRVDDLQHSAKPDATKILLPHQQIVLNKVSGQVVKSTFKDETPITAWKDGILSFQNATMDEVINSIQNRFNVTITNSSSRTDWSYTGTFKDESLNDVLKTVCLTEGISCTINQNNITLK